ncbi:hypothetical protein GOP47_0019425 [Adiantum capillus-veneris]|uniref:Uncharacterized protein n=1 Tax=Adiantum capillus-veneris TaxID=13818 RepID=A0A9D4UBA5_ADICA|nr:hypothetical protein GOP47_0019425 [Adiantum capillus-veneris]
METSIQEAQREYDPDSRLIIPPAQLTKDVIGEDLREQQDHKHIPELSDARGSKSRLSVPRVRPEMRIDEETGGPAEVKRGLVTL